jgi:hypothetical protein
MNEDDIDFCHLHLLCASYHHDQVFQTSGQWRWMIAGREGAVLDLPEDGAVELLK